MLRHHTLFYHYAFTLFHLAITIKPDLVQYINADKTITTSHAFLFIQKFRIIILFEFYNIANSVFYYGRNKNVETKKNYSFFCVTKNSISVNMGT